MISLSLQLTGPFDVGNHVTSAFKSDASREPHSVFFWKAALKVDPHRATEKDRNNSGLLIEVAFGKKKENEREMK